MNRDDAREAARRCHAVLEPLHAMVYFASETQQVYASLGLEPGRMAYFASRGGPLGAVGPGVIAATFYSFNPELVARHIPRAWSHAAPADVVDARFEVADRALRRLLGEERAESEAVAELAGLLRRVADACRPEGRPLYAAHADLEWPKGSLIELWHATTLLREYRGDGHIAALVNHGFAGLPALVTHTVTGKGFTEANAKKLRGWSDEQWASAAEELREQGFLDEHGLTDAGAEARRRIEEDTDAAAAAPYAMAGAETVARIERLGGELSAVVQSAGAFPPGLFADGR